MTPRPLSVTAIAWLFVAVGIIGFAYHAADVSPRAWPEDDLYWVLGLRVLALVCGVMMLRGSNWARWTALAWMAYHVVLSAYHSVSEVLIHLVFLVVIALCLLNPRASAYFRHPKGRAGQPAG
jgi:hypothetical protein